MSRQEAGPRIGMIWAQTLGGVIGANGTMPWHLPEDLEHFRRTTNGHPVVMGRRTWDSFPARYRPLPGRTNIVITGQQDWAADGAVVVHSLDEGLAAARTASGSDEIWVLGGGKVFGEAAPGADTAVVTIIDSHAAGDTHAPELGPDWTRQLSDPADGWHTSRNGTRYRFEHWTRTPGVA
ncbi:dihydrofolate reductase [Paenarthrobacter sp. DKR-5]|uniref:dihydrofolate reductase n=1 Tax=Paenarthrobacter sp. DKR-5 TaxID=2835535 RepID=UPI001BDCD906|nr:dihydrofolate reductase [Paenarthrobacter sp. DKR-5]MBT1001131.1 dihydrofolate reductase [Paenarthrobacter sp. DKR-5]